MKKQRRNVMQQNKFDRYYTKYVVKSPLVFGGFIIIGFFLFFWLTLTNKAYIMKTYNARFHVSNGKYTIEFIEQMPLASSGYIYVDRNEAMIPIDYVPLSFNKAEVISDKMLPFSDGTEIKIDIIEREVSLLYLIFIKGGGT